MKTRNGLPPAKWATGKDKDNILLINGKCLNRLETKHFTFMDWIEAYPGKTIDYSEATWIGSNVPWSKGYLIELCYGKNHTGIDTAIPQCLWDRYDPHMHVMVYEPHSADGKLVNLLERAYELGITIADPVVDNARLQWAMDRYYEQKHINQER